ncbi:hypothetical protein ACFOON_11405 [Novosphingobium piscinae]|uniref:Uncharacterized protein n=1 Tax=Novosphingobium piscinae TaxID=1507448 RepID=A0A7X1KPA9_9SPHN|nr:hypothetical protein [Novosphingobium piscinae]MBC2668175.1 hypothetical protein [Novosphingobium piscinae]
MPALRLLPSLGFATVLLAPAPAEAAMVAPPAVAVGSAVYVEHLGAANRVLERSDQLRRGDRVVTIVSWKRPGPGGAFTLVNPLPRTVQFDGTADGTEEVSADGGRTWGRLGQLRAAGRLVLAQDVTHVRWRVASPSAAGRIAYRAIVR